MSTKKLPLSKILALELNRAVLKQRVDEHDLHQLFWECTLRCNLNCRHCGSDCRTDSQLSDMPFEDFRTVLDEIKSKCNPANVLVITTGGEPLMRPDIVSCGKKITSLGYKWGLVTNGMLLTQQKLDELLDAGLSTLAISLDGFESDHNWLRGNPLSYSRVMAAIDALSETKDLVWDVITCVNKRNISHLNELSSLMRDKKVPAWRLFSVFPFGRAVSDEMLKLDNKQFVEMLNFIREMRKSGEIKVSYGCDGFLGPFEGEVRDRYFSCSAGINVASVLADGSISGCLSIRNDYYQGNIYRDSFWNIWQNKFQKYRNHDWMKTGQCSNCKAWRYCLGNGMHLRDSNGNGTLCHYSMIRTEE
jgi:radical SAM additional 4Fe4S-binding domain